MGGFIEITNNEQREKIENLKGDISIWEISFTYRKFDFDQWIKLATKRLTMMREMPSIKKPSGTWTGMKKKLGDLVITWQDTFTQVLEQKEGMWVIFLGSTWCYVGDQMRGVKQLVNPCSNKIIYHGLLRNISLEYSNIAKWVLVYGVECIFYEHEVKCFLLKPQGIWVYFTQKKKKKREEEEEEKSREFSVFIFFCWMCFCFVLYL